MKATSLITIAFAFAMAGSADARPRPHGIQGKKFEANKKFGAGLEFGEPSGLTGKYFIATDRALDFGFGYIYDSFRDAYFGVHIYLDHLWHPVSLASTEPFELPLYIGVGGRFWDWEDRRDPNFIHGYGVGVRVPIGIAFDFNNIPLDIFFQAVPTLDLFFNTPTGYRRTIFLTTDVSIGIRYYFN